MLQIFLFIASILIDKYNIGFSKVIMASVLWFGFNIWLLDDIGPKYLKIKYYTGEDNTKDHDMITRKIIIKTGMNYLMFYVMTWLMWQSSPINPSSHLKEFTKLIGGLVQSSVLFYLLHRLAHTRYLYKYIHKSHHMFNNPFACVALYSGHVEFLMVNCTSIFLPIYLLSMCRSYGLIYSLIGIRNIIVAHTTYEFVNKPMNLIFGNSYFHHIHHAKNIYNYGLETAFMDWILGTMYKKQQDTEKSIEMLDK